MYFALFYAKFISVDQEDNKYKEGIDLFAATCCSADFEAIAA